QRRRVPVRRRPGPLGQVRRLQALLRAVRRPRRGGRRRQPRALEGLQGRRPRRGLLATDRGRRLGKEGLAAHSLAMCAPLAATERFINGTTTTSAAVTTANTQKQSK